MLNEACESVVLVIDDDRDVRLTIAEVLADEGYGVVVAADGRDALEWLRDGKRPCVILLDLMMPVMDGLTFYAEQHKDPALANIPVVVISAYAKMQGALPDGVEYLPKPTRLDSLLSAVARHCA